MALVFTRDTDVYVNYTSNAHTNNYKLHVSSVEFDQTFRQTGYGVKTIDSPHSLIENSSITEANPANFSITFFMIDNDTVSYLGQNYPYQHILLELLLNNTGSTLNTFSLYVDPSVSTTADNLRRMYLLSNCVAVGGTFEITRNGLLKVQVVGQASQLTRVNYSAFNIGTGYKSFDTVDYAVSKLVNVTMDSSILQDVYGVALDIQNEIEWTKNSTLHNSLEVSSYTQTIYPASFTLKNRTVAGSITQYVGNDLNSYSNIQTWKENIPIRLQAGLAANNYQLDAQLTPCSFTNRVSPTEMYSQSYDYRMIGHPTNLNTLFTY